MKKRLFFFLLLLFPIQVLAYSDRLVLGGEPIGIEIHAKGVYVVDFYKVNNQDIGRDAGFKKGDFITKVDDSIVSSTLELENSLKDGEKHIITVERGGKKKEIPFTSVISSDKIETGLYVKDVINGVGTLSYIDPETKVFASLGHEIVESNSNQRFQIQNGYIYDAKINYIHKSSNGNIGEFHANLYNSVRGSIHKNEINGIYGKYTDSLDGMDLLDVGSAFDIHLGDAYIRCSFDSSTDLYSMKILDIYSNDDVKNIFFEITDDRLLDSTGGIVQGMSGSPIIQDNKIIGVVNYVVVNDSKKGYGIFIEKMLEEGDLLLKE